MSNVDTNHAAPRGDKELSPAKELPPSFDSKIWDLENDINSLKETELLEDEEKVFEEILSQYNVLDANLQKEIQAFKLLIDDKAAEDIDTLTSYDGSLSLKVSENNMAVFMSLTPPVGKGRFVIWEDIIEKLKNEGICYGRHGDHIDRLLRIYTEEKKEICNELIAEGLESKRGIDGKVELLFEKNDKNSADENGVSAAYVYKSVSKDQILARIFPPTKGVPGKDVFNNDLPVIDGEEVQLVAGENVMYLPEQNAFVSVIDGIAGKQGNTLVVKHVLVVKGDVDVPRGNIEFDGMLRIEGTVRDGLSVKAKGDILIGGGVEGATVVSHAGSIIVRNGIVGQGRCYVSAGKDVIAKFIENGVVNANGNIRVQEAILHSRISAGEKVSAVSGKGTITGGVIKAGNLAHAKKFGALGEPYTTVKLGINLASQKAIEQIEQQLAVVKQTYTRITQTLEKIMGTSTNMTIFPEETRQKLAELKKTVLILHFKETRFVNMIDNLEQQSLSTNQGDLIATEALFANVHVFIGNAVFHARKEYQRLTLHYDQEKQKIVTTEK